MAMTDQEMFDAVVAHCVEQGKPAYDADADRCFYRMDNGCKCAIGALIPDDRYDPSMEGYRAYGVIEDFNLRDIIPETGLAEDFQTAHDDPAARGLTGTNWQRECLTILTVVAPDHNISPATAQAALSKLEQSS